MPVRLGLHIHARHAPRVFHKPRDIGLRKIAHHGNGQGELLDEMFLQLPLRERERLVELELGNEIADHGVAHAGLSAGELSDPADADFALAEIVEYVRVSVQIVLEEIADTRSNEAGLTTSMSEH